MSCRLQSTKPDCFNNKVDDVPLHFLVSYHLQHQECTTMQPTLLCSNLFLLLFGCCFVPILTLLFLLLLWLLSLLIHCNPILFCSLFLLLLLLLPLGRPIAQGRRIRCRVVRACRGGQRPLCLAGLGILAGLRLATHGCCLGTRRAPLQLPELRLNLCGKPTVCVGCAFEEQCMLSEFLPLPGERPNGNIAPPSKRATHTRHVLP